MAYSPTLLGYYSEIRRILTAKAGAIPQPFNNTCAGHLYEAVRVMGGNPAALNGGDTSYLNALVDLVRAAVGGTVGTYSLTEAGLTKELSRLVGGASANNTRAWLAGAIATGFTGISDFGLLAYWSVTKAVTSGGLIESIPGSKSRTLSKSSPDSTRLALTAGRAIGTAGANTRLIENPAALQPRKLTATTVVTAPDATGCDAGKGFTLTGGVRLPDGTYVMMNFGVPTEASGATPLPSLVRVSSDLSAPVLLGQTPLASISATITTGAQGVGYDRNDGRVFFWAANYFWFVHPTTGAFVRSVPFTAFAVNGVEFDPATDEIVASATGNNSSVNWINKITGAITRTVPIAGTAIDHLRFADGYLWCSGGDNGAAQGGAIRQLDVTPGRERVVGEWFTDAGAPEGLFVNGSEVWLNNDGYYHNPPGDPTNTFRRYVLDPAPGTYPGAGRKAVAAWVGHVVTPTGGATMAWAIGEPTASGQRGIGVSYPATVTDTLRVYANNVFISFATTTNVEAVWAVIWDFDAKTARLRKNGEDVATTAFAGLSDTVLYPTMQTVLLATREDVAISRSATASGANLMIGYNTDMLDRFEGEVAWDAGVQALLPVGHAYKNARPVFVPPIG